MVKLYCSLLKEINEKYLLNLSESTVVGIGSRHAEFSNSFIRATS